MRLLAAIVVGLALVPEARAGGGPWTLSPDDRTLFVGGGYTRWQHLDTGDGGDPMDVGTPITRTDLNGELTYGLVKRTEAEFRAGLAWAGVSDTTAGPCEDGDLCQTTIGFTPVRARLKIQALDDFSTPLALATGFEVRFGDFTRDNRHRITALGDGQTDLGAFVSLGRTGGLGSWSYSTHADVTGRWRLKIAEVAKKKAPADELAALGEFLLYPAPNVSLGPAFDLVHSLGGVDFVDTDQGSLDRFTALSVTSLKIGGKLNIRSTENVTVSLSALGTAVARNNPTDFFTVGVGVGTWTPHKTREEP